MGGDRAWLSSCHVEWGRQRGASFPAGLLDGWGSRLHFSHRSRVFSPLFPQAAQPSPVITLEAQVSTFPWCLSLSLH